MLKQKFVFAVSLIAMVTVGIGAARADIASTVYVQQGVNSAKTAASAAQTSANNANTAAGAAQTSADNAQAAAEAAQASADSAAASAKTANDAIAGLDLTQVGADGSYIKTVKQADGKVTATAEAADTTPTANSKKMVTSGGVYTALSGKQATLTTSNIKGAGSVSVGIANGVITVTGTDNNTTYSTGTSSAAGLTKLYTGTGSGTDGTMTQAAITTALSGKLSTSGTAAKATADASGNNIVNTYATKTALAAKEATANKLTSTATTTVTDDNKDTLYPTVGKTQAMIDALDVTDSAVSGKYVSAVSETDGKISVTRASLPAVNNATLTIQKNGVTVDTFTANASSNKTINITVPTGSLASKSAVTSSDITDGTIATADIADGAVTSAKLAANAVTSAKISDGTIVDADISTGAAIAQSKISGLTTALAAKEATANKLTTDATTTISETNQDTLYPTIGRVMKEIDDTVTEVNNDISALNSGLNSLQTTVNGKQATLTTSNIKGAGSVSVGIANGVITVTGTDNDTKYTLPAATSSTLGGVKIGSNISNSSGTISVPVATSSALGVVKTGTNISNSSGTISVATGTPSTLGVVKVGQIPSGSATSSTYATIWVE